MQSSQQKMKQPDYNVSLMKPWKNYNTNKLGNRKSMMIISTDHPDTIPPKSGVIVGSHGADHLRHLREGGAERLPPPPRRRQIMDMTIDLLKQSLLITLVIFMAGVSSLVAGRVMAREWRKVREEGK